MLSRRTIHKAKRVFTERLKNLKSFLHGGHHKSSKTPSFITSPCSDNNPKMQPLDNLYRDVSDGSELDQNKLVDKEKNHSIANGTRIEGNVSDRQRKETKKTSCRGFLKQSGKEREFILAEKMKELEMMEASDVDHVLDIEEALHHYSLLTCPVYQDIVDNFFMDMYSEFLLPQPSAGVNSSRRTFRSLRL